MHFFYILLFFLPIDIKNKLKETNKIIYKINCSFPSSLIPLELIIEDKSVIDVAYKNTPIDKIKEIKAKTFLYSGNVFGL